MDKILETERLVLRALNGNDFENLCTILQDAEVMYAYEHAFSDAEVREWLARQLERYKRDGFGLWGVLQKSTGAFIGQCGLTMQDIGRVAPVVEIGYLFRKDAWHQGYATEAAAACREYAFGRGMDEVYSIIRDTNAASRRVALRNGMKLRGSIVKHYYGMDMPHDIYSVRRDGE